MTNLDPQLEFVGFPKIHRLSRSCVVTEKIDGTNAPGFMKPEGIVVYHIQGNVAFKKTFEKDNTGKEA
jgi:hypothetical protein